MTPTKRHRTTHLYRYVAIGFGTLAAVLLAVVGYVAFSRARVTITLESRPVRTTFSFSVGAGGAADRVLDGRYLTETVRGSEQIETVSTIETPTRASGTVRITNSSGSDQPLAATTRLLSTDGVLFRTTERVDVPAHGSLDVTVVADEPGRSGEIGPSRFTIPGLRPANQELIYGESFEPMAGGVRVETVVTDADEARTRAALTDELLARAQATLTAAIDGEGRALAIVGHEVVSESIDELTLSRTLTVQAIAYDPAAFEVLRRRELSEAALAGDRILSVVEQDLPFTLKEADPDAQTAIVSTSASGRAVLDETNPIIATTQLTGRTRAELERYAATTSGIASIEVSLSPFWSRRTPRQPSRIDRVLRVAP